MRGVARLILYLLAGLGLLWLVVTLTPLDFWWATELAGPWDDPKGDVLIVLGGSVLDDGMIGESSYLRSVYAVLAYREGGFRRVILSGEDVAQAMRQFIECYGVPHSAIQIEPQSRSTRENALYIKEVLAGTEGRKVLLTSDFHMFRACRTFKKAGLDVLPRPFPDVRKRAMSWRARWPAFLDLVEETIKIGYYWYRGWI